MSTDQERMAIPLSKSKIVLLTIGAFAFVAASIWLWSIADEQTRRNPMVIKAVSVAGVLFFGLCGLYGIRKLFDNQEGLIIDKVGIHDNSSALGKRSIKRENIEGFDMGQVQHTKFLLVLVNNPEEIITRESKWKQQVLRMNMKMYGTPIAIASSSSLQCNFKELTQILTDRFETEKKDKTAC